MSHTLPNDATLDLTFERIVNLPREKIWAAWTTPALITQWFTPAPWQTVDAEIDLRPGGVFRTVMRSPDGEEFPNIGCYLAIEPPYQLVWSNAFLPGFRPANLSDPALPDCGMFAFTGVLTLEAVGDKTRYTARVLHGDEAACKRHADMGFYEGWGKALDQLVALMSNTKMAIP